MTASPSSATGRTNAHGTTLALGQWAAMITGPPGAGKSDLALRCLTTCPNALIPGPARLVSDDQTTLECRDGWIYTSAPPAIKGKLEVRGLGLIDVEPIDQARLVLLVDVAGPPNDRLPPEPLPTELILGRPIARISLAPFEPSAQIRLLLALKALGGKAMVSQHINFPAPARRRNDGIQPS